MKTIVFGDIHGRDIWKYIQIKHADADRFIFLGDYVSTHERDITEDMQIQCVKDVLDFAEHKNREKPGTVILLRGNHDMQHLGYYWAECSGRFMHVQKWMMENEERFLKNTQWLFVDDGIVYVHAGVTRTWMQRNGLTDINEINGLEPSEKFGFTPCKLSDYYGDSKTQPPTWIRPWSFFEDSFGEYTYIVGHTTTKHVNNVKEEILGTEWGRTMYDHFKDKNVVWTCDCLGSGEYMIVEDGNISIGKI